MREAPRATTRHPPLRAPPTPLGLMRRPINVHCVLTKPSHTPARTRASTPPTHTHKYTLSCQEHTRTRGPRGCPPTELDRAESPLVQGEAGFRVTSFSAEAPCARTHARTQTLYTHFAPPSPPPPAGTHTSGCEEPRRTAPLSSSLPSRTSSVRLTGDQTHGGIRACVCARACYLSTTCHCPAETHKDHPMRYS